MRLVSRRTILCRRCMGRSRHGGARRSRWRMTGSPRRMRRTLALPFLPWHRWPLRALRAGLGRDGRPCRGTGGQGWASWAIIGPGPSRQGRTPRLGTGLRWHRRTGRCRPRLGGTRGRRAIIGTIAPRHGRARRPIAPFAAAHPRHRRLWRTAWAVTCSRCGIGSPANTHFIAKLLHHRRAQTGHIGQFIDRTERAVLTAVIDNGLRLDRANALEAIELFGARRIDVELGAGHAAPQQQAGGQTQKTRNHARTPGARNVQYAISDHRLHGVPTNRKRLETPPLA